MNGLYQKILKWQHSTMVLTKTPVIKKFTVAISPGSGILHSMLKYEFTLQYRNEPGPWTTIVEAESEEVAFDMIDWTYPEEVMVLNFKLVE